MNRSRLFRFAAMALALILAFALGRALAPQAPPSGGTAEVAEAPTTWTCSMHPSIQLPEPGDCPICGMDLIPLEEGADESEVELSMSEAARRLAEIQTTLVRRQFPEMELRLVGKIDYDETRLRKITAWVGGRLERLYVDYEGIAIREGDHMVELYSPELVSAQEELLQAHRATVSAESSGNDVLLDSARRNLAAARDKLRLLGLDAGQIDAVVGSGRVSDVIELRAPIDGVVLEKHALEGAYVETGSPIYTIADLTHLWVKMDAYESDLVWLRYGQKVTFTTEALPGREFEGTVSFIDPVLDPRTRTAKVRVNVDNSARALKPGMFVRATVHPKVAGPGRVVAADLRGKWICPMHPEVIADGPDDCDICGMDLVPLEELGYRALESDPEPPLVIPASAPLITGKRAVVYVEVPGAERPTYQGREVVLGPRARDVYVVESGLDEGERVVTQGAFKIDSAMQIQAKPSMMLPADEATRGLTDHEGGHDHEDVAEASVLEVPEEFRRRLGAFTEAFLDFTHALAADDADAARQATDAMGATLSAVGAEGLEGEARTLWDETQDVIARELEALESAADLEALRAGLSPLTDTLTPALRRLGVEAEGPVRRFHCPMARSGEGGDWLQRGTEVENPYYGASMFRCGSAVETLTEESP